MVYGRYLMKLSLACSLILLVSLLGCGNPKKYLHDYRSLNNKKVKKNKKLKAFYSEKDAGSFANVTFASLDMPKTSSKKNIFDLKEKAQRGLVERSGFDTLSNTEYFNTLSTPIEASSKNKLKENTTFTKRLVFTVSTKQFVDHRVEVEALTIKFFLEPSQNIKIHSWDRVETVTEDIDLATLEQTGNVSMSISPKLNLLGSIQGEAGTLFGGKSESKSTKKYTLTKPKANVSLVGDTLIVKIKAKPREDIERNVIVDVTLKSKLSTIIPVHSIEFKKDSLFSTNSYLRVPVDPNDISGGISTIVFLKHIRNKNGRRSNYEWKDRVSYIKLKGVNKKVERTPFYVDDGNWPMLGGYYESVTLERYPLLSKDEQLDKLWFLYRESGKVDYLFQYIEDASTIGLNDSRKDAKDKTNDGSDDGKSINDKGKNDPIRSNRGPDFDNNDESSNTRASFKLLYRGTQEAGEMYSMAEFQDFMKEYGVSDQLVFDTLQDGMQFTLTLQDFDHLYLRRYYAKKTGWEDEMVSLSTYDEAIRLRDWLRDNHRLTLKTPYEFLMYQELTRKFEPLSEDDIIEKGEFSGIRPHNGTSSLE